MKLSLVMMAAAAAFAAPAEDQQAALAPDSSTDRDMQALLSMDSFNITSADSEQNRMHAVCDMEYRLSKMAGGKVQTTSLMAAGSSTTSSSSTAASLFNPFTMPLMAVKQHIALLQQEEKFLQAQSDAFSGGSSSATTAAPANVKVSSCGWIANDGTDPNTKRAAGARVATDTLVASMETLAVAQINQELIVTLDFGEALASPAQTVVLATPALTGTDAVGTGKRPCYLTSGTDGPCKNAAGAAMAGTGITINGALTLSTGTASTSASLNPEGSAATAAGAAANAVSATDVKTGNAGIMVGYKLAEGLQQLATGSHWLVGLITNAGTTKTVTATFEFKAGTATATPTLLGKASCTTDI